MVVRVRQRNAGKVEIVEHTRLRQLEKITISAMEKKMATARIEWNTSAPIDQNQRATTERRCGGASTRCKSRRGTFTPTDCAVLSCDNSGFMTRKSKNSTATRVDFEYRTYIVKSIIYYNKNFDFKNSERDGRSVISHWFFKKLTNGQTCHRTWLELWLEVILLLKIPFSVFRVNFFFIIQIKLIY